MIWSDLEDCPLYVKDLGVIDAWKFSTGNDVQILVVDTCIDEKHQAFGNSITKDSVCKPKEPQGHDANYMTLFGQYYHGTAVAGSIVAKNSTFPLYNTTDQHIKICGIAPQAHVHGFDMDLSMLDPEELNGKLDDLISFEPFNLAIKSKKPLFKERTRSTVIGSISIVQDTRNASYQEGWNQFMRDACTKDSFLGVVAVGNDGVNLHDHQNKYIPANLEKPIKCKYDPLLRVGSLDMSNISKAEHSNYGFRVDILAPGVNIPVLVPFDKSYIASGTSFATPIVSGTIALLLECDPLAKASDIRRAILDNADKHTHLSSYVKDGNVLNVSRSVRAFCLNNTKIKTTTPDSDEL